MIKSVDELYYKYLESCASQKKSVEAAKRLIDAFQTENCSPSDVRATIGNVANALLWGIKHGERAWLALRDMYEEVVEIYGPLTCKDNVEWLESRLNGELEAMNIAVERTDENWIHIKLPHFITQFGNIKASNRVWEPLDKALKMLNPEHMLYSEKCDVVFIQHISKYSHTPLKDNDNITLKCIVNLLSRNFLADDCAEYLDLHIYSVSDDGNYVDVFLLPETEFIAFYSKNFCKTAL